MTKMRNFDFENGSTAVDPKFTVKQPYQNGRTAST
jgi:hypothetical protein